MDAEQLRNMDESYVEREHYERLLNDLIDRINVPAGEVQLSQIDKLTISYGIQFLRLELTKKAGPNAG